MRHMRATLLNIQRTYGVYKYAVSILICSLKVAETCRSSLIYISIRAIHLYTMFTIADILYETVLYILGVCL
jgi:hypothetical protein